MPGCVSCRLYLLLDVLEKIAISLDLRSREISNFPKHHEVNTADRNTRCHNILYLLYTLFTLLFLIFRLKVKINTYN